MWIALTSLLVLAAMLRKSLASESLTLTALLSSQQGVAYFECWEMAAPFKKYPTAGKAILGLADVSNISYVVLPPRSDEGLHNPPYPMFFVLLSGLAHVTLPGSDDELMIVEGVNGLMIAADTVGDGHRTTYPSDKDTVALQIPFADGKLPSHSLLHVGVCHGNGVSFTPLRSVPDDVGQQTLL